MQHKSRNDTLTNRHVLGLTKLALSDDDPDTKNQAPGQISEASTKLSFYWLQVGDHFTVPSTIAYFKFVNLQNFNFKKMKKFQITFIVVIFNLFYSCAYAQADYKKGQTITDFTNTNFHNVVKLRSSNQKKKPKNIILLIGDGMGASQVYAGFTANKGQLNMTQMPITGFSKTNSSNDYITDSAAGGTAIACGTKTNNGVIGMDSLFEPVKSILELAEENKMSSGLVSTSSVTHATPASFIAHQKSRNMSAEIAADFLKTDIDVIIGGGMKLFTQKTDKVNLLNQFKAKGYNVCDNIEDISKQTKGPLLGLLADRHTETAKIRGDMLLKSTKTAIEILKKSPKGFFLMVEGSQIDWAGHQNNIENVVRETLDFDKAVGAALEFADKDGETLVIVAADHETGGMSITGGNIEQGKVIAKFSKGSHTAVMVPVFAFGPGADEFGGFYENTAIFDKMVNALKLNVSALSR